MTTTKILSLPAEDFMKALHLTAFAVSTDATRPNLRGVWIANKADAIHFLATDGRRAAIFNSGLSGVLGGWGEIIPDHAMLGHKTFLLPSDVLKETARWKKVEGMVVIEVVRIAYTAISTLMIRATESNHVASCVIDFHAANCVDIWRVIPDEADTLESNPCQAFNPDFLTDALKGLRKALGARCPSATKLLYNNHPGGAMRVKFAALHGDDQKALRDGASFDYIIMPMRMRGF
jgi:hypothetical protein